MNRSGLEFPFRPDEGLMSTAIAAGRTVADSFRSEHTKLCSRRGGQSSEL